MTSAAARSDAPRPRDVVAALPRYSRAAGADTVRWRASSNESTVPPSRAVLDAITRAGADAHRYPPLSGDGLVDALAQHLGLPSDGIVVGGGSLAVLQQALTAYTGPGTEVVYPWRSYEAYPILVGLAGADGVPVALDPALRNDVDALASAVTARTAAVLVCNPNNPTGTVIGADALTRLLEAVPSHVLVLLDEAYIEFADTAPVSGASDAGTTVDGVRLIAAHPNLVVFRTFSKAYGLAGLRAGYAVASPDVADAVRAAAPPFGLSAVAQAAAVAALGDPEHTAHIVGTVRTGRERLRAAVAALGVRTPPSGSNFVWLDVGEGAAALERACVAHGVSVRAFPGEGVRVTVGERDAEDAVLAAVREYTGTPPVPTASGSGTP